MNKRLASFDFIVSCLSAQSDSYTNENLHSAIVSGRLDWQLILNIANIQKITPAFWVALKTRRLAEYLPPETRKHLFKNYLLNALKNKDFVGQAIEAVRQLNSIGIEPILLKGGASLFVKTFDDPGSRFMADLDILIPKKSAEECWNALRNLGYLPIETSSHFHVDYQGCHHHLHPLYHPNRYGTIEIHKDALPNSAARILPTSLIWEQSEFVPDQFSLMMRVPSPTHRLLHNLLHSDLINETYARGKLSLWSLYELAALQAIYRERIDWATISELMIRGGQAHILEASLYLTHRLLGSPIVDGIYPTLGSAVHHARTRLQIRWDWLDQLVERAFYFSKDSICERYNCDDSFWSLTKGRLHLSALLSWKYINQVSRFIGRQLSMGSTK